MYMMEKNNNKNNNDSHHSPQYDTTWRENEWANLIIVQMTGSINKKQHLFICYTHVRYTYVE